MQSCSPGENTPFIEAVIKNSAKMFNKLLKADCGFALEHRHPENWGHKGKSEIPEATLQTSLDAVSLQAGHNISANFPYVSGLGRGTVIVEKTQNMKFLP